MANEENKVFNNDWIWLYFEKNTSFFTKEIGVIIFCLLKIPGMAFSIEDCAEPFFCPETVTHVCTSQNGQSLSPATPPGGLLTLWAGWSGAVVCWWCITKTCRRLCSRSSASSRHFWTSHQPRRGCSALTATRTATSNAWGPSTPPSTRSALPWGRWSTPSLTLWTRRSRAGTLADFHRSTSPDDGLQLDCPLCSDCCSWRLWNGDSDSWMILTECEGLKDSRWDSMDNVSPLGVSRVTVLKACVLGHAVREFCEDLRWFVALHSWD